jgi:hypothetical protein
MTTPQKIIIAVLSLIAVGLMAGVACLFVFLYLPQPEPQLQLAAAAVEQPAPTALPTPTSPPEQTATPAPTEAVEPTATSTLVVIETVQPTPTPTRANCVDTVRNFGASGLITDEEVKQFLRDTLPFEHLDGCRGIEYFHQAGQLHGTPIAGSIIPIYREIQVFAVDPEFQTADLILDTLTHEVGHNVHKNIRSETMELDGQWAQLHQQSQDSFQNNGMGFVSDYARTNKFEDFAESYMAYVRYPETLKFFNPAKYEFMRVEVFDGYEYEP